MTPCVADVAGPWIDSDFESGLIERCKRYWCVPVSELPNEMLATYLRQEIAVEVILPEARRRLEAGIDDDSEMFEWELAEVVQRMTKT